MVLAARNGPELDAVKKEVARHGTRIETYRGDVSSAGQVKGLVDFAVQSFGTIDVLVNCAGIYGPIGLVTDIDVNEWVEAIKINLFGTFFCIKYTLPIMMEKKRGKIITMSGGGAASPIPRFSAYSTSKAGVARLTETLAEEVRQYHIDINAIAPGAVNTGFLDQVIQAGEAAGKEFFAKSLKQKEVGGVSPERVAELAVFLASPQSDGVTGRLISLLWDNWRELPGRLDQLNKSDIYTLRRIVPEDRGLKW